MSTRGVHSNRGDGYQTTIAAGWAIAALHESIDWIELDSTSLDLSGNPIAVDDVVIGYKDQPTQYCQCKKNQPQFASWTAAGLKDDLTKAGAQLARDRHCLVRFYSRNNFGELSWLREHALTQSDSAAFIHTIPAGRNACLETLEEYWGPALVQAKSTVFEFIKRIHFEVTGDIEDLQKQQIGLLRQYVTQADDVYEILFARLDSIARRFSGGHPYSSTVDTHRFTQDDLSKLLANAGSTRTLRRSEGELTNHIRQISAVGRHWRRAVGGIRLSRSLLQRKVMDTVADKPKTVLIHDAPGYGKTCVLLNLVETLESSSAQFVLFIQGREYAQCKSDAERTAIGLVPDVIGIIARAAELRHTVVIIDSLDVLSLARDHSVLGYFLSMIDRLALVPNVTVVAACRSFDLKYDDRLAHRDWAREVCLGALDWQAEVAPFLADWGVREDVLNESLKRLLGNPRMLALFEEAHQHEGFTQIHTEQELSERYLEVVVLRDPLLGTTAMDHIARLAATMLAQRRLEVPRARANLPIEIEKALLSAEVLIEVAPGQLTFEHQTLFDVLAVRHAQQIGDTLLQFILKQSQTPFVRPSIRAFFFNLRAREPMQFSKQVRAALSADTVAFHLKRLIAESIAEILPIDEDWFLVNYLLQSNAALFAQLLLRIRTPSWFELLEVHWLPDLLANRDEAQILQFAERISLLKHIAPAVTVAFWHRAIALPWVDVRRLRWIIALELRDFAAGTMPGVRSLLEWIVDTAPIDHDLAAAGLCKFVEATDSGDDLLWRYIVSETGELKPHSHLVKPKLRCDAQFAPIPEFLPQRMLRSDTLLNLAVASVENWGSKNVQSFQDRRIWDDHFLASTSWAQRHRSHLSSYIEPSTALFRALEAACLARAANQSAWWVQNESRLRNSTDGALRYIALRAYADDPEANIAAIEQVLHDDAMLEAPALRDEMGELIHGAFALLSDADQACLQDKIIELGEAHLDLNPDEVVQWRRNHLASIPAFLRTRATQAYLDEARRLFPYGERTLHVESWGGFVAPAISDNEIAALSDEALLQLLNYLSTERAGRSQYAFSSLGLDSVSPQISNAVSFDPERYLKFLRTKWTSIPHRFRAPILEGVANHLRYRFGNLTPSGTWVPLKTPDGAQLSGMLLTELEIHWYVWRERSQGADALKACAYVMPLESDKERFAFLLVGLWGAAEPGSGKRAESGGLIEVALSSARGVAAEAAGILASRIGSAGVALPGLLESSLVYLSKDDHPAVRAILVHYLPVVQAHFPFLGWKCFARAVTNAPPALWLEAERCLYYAYDRSFDRVAQYLNAIEFDMAEGVGAVWGRISALAVLSGHIDPDTLLTKLRANVNSDAWRGAASVFAANASKREFFEICIVGLLNALDDGTGIQAATIEMTTLFRADPPVAIPDSLLRRYFEVLRTTDRNQGTPVHDFQLWLARRVQSSPDDGLTAVELALQRGPDHALHIWDHDLYPALLTRLFREAEDREESDEGIFLARVIKVQDSFLKLGTHVIDQWLRDAERP